MKRILILLAALAVSLLSLSANAQDGQFFNHVGLGFTAGVDGVGVEAVVPASSLLQIRAGYSIFPFKYDKTLNLGTVHRDSGYDLNFSNVPVTGNIWKGGLGKVMLDIYPIKDVPFRIIAGAFVGSGKLVAVKADLHSAVHPEDYRTGIRFRDVSFSTDENGYGYVDACVMKVLPYLGIGYGRALNVNKRVGFGVELGAMYTGGIKFQTYNYANSSNVQTSVLTSSTFADDSGKLRDRGLIDKVSRIPVLPMLKLGVYFRLF